MSKLINLAQEQFTELSNLINAICNMHNAKIRMAWSNEDLYCINVDADNIDTIVDMNFELADKITSNRILENLDFIVKFESYQPQLKTRENEMNLSQEIEKIVKQTIQDYFASQKQIALNGDVNIEVTLDAKPMTGDIVAVRDGKLVTGDRLIANAEIKASKITENSVHKKASAAFDELILRYGFVVMSEVAKSKI